MRTYRCPDCKQCWPDDKRFIDCPECKVKCWYKAEGAADTVIALDEALRAKAYVDFEIFYLKKCSREDENALAVLAGRDPLYVEHIIPKG